MAARAGGGATCAGVGVGAAQARAAARGHRVDGDGECGELAHLFGKHIYRLNSPLTAVDPVDPQIPSRPNPPRVS